MLSLNHNHSRSDIKDGKMKKTNLTYEDRIIIENGIEKRLSFASIAKQIGKERSTISREVKRNRTYDMGTAPKGSIKCRYLKEGCRMNHYCGTCIKKDCHSCQKIVNIFSSLPMCVTNARKGWCVTGTNTSIGCIWRPKRDRCALTGVKCLYIDYVRLVDTLTMLRGAWRA